MDDKLKEILQRILNNEDDNGCAEDVTTTSKDAMDDLRTYLVSLKHFGGVKE